MREAYTYQNKHDGIRTASSKELREHVEWVGILVLAALVGLQALFAMSVVNLPFLLSAQHGVVSLRKYDDELYGQRGSHTL